MDNSQEPSTESLAHTALAGSWAMIRAIRRGAKAVRDDGAKFLIKFPSEGKDEYDRRLKAAPWRPEFVDALQTLSAKPFTKEVKLDQSASAEFATLAADIDGQGNNLHVFAKDCFEGAVAMGAHGILVDFPTGAGGLTLAQERAAGVRPYWVAINADDILEYTTKQQGGRRICSYLRIKESRVERKGFAQQRVPLIREIEPFKFRVWREVRNADKVEWVVESEGTTTFDEVPFVFFATGDKEGDQCVQPPLIDLADMQIELYNALSKKEQIFTIAGSPMLTANGMAPPADNSAIETGPGRVLYAPGGEGVNASWAYIQPNAANLKEIREDIAEIISDIRRLGMQPMLPRTGTVTATASGIEAAKAHTVLQAWAISLKDALEQAFKFTAKWMNAEAAAPNVMVHTDFAVGLYGAEEVTTLLDARKEAQISQETFWDEMQRRGVLGPQFDAEAERKRLAVENPPFDPAGQLDPASDPNNPDPLAA